MLLGCWAVLYRLTAQLNTVGAVTFQCQSAQQSQRAASCQRGEKAAA